jgi:hypothetical protein
MSIAREPAHHSHLTEGILESVAVVFREIHVIELVGLSVEERTKTVTVCVGGEAARDYIPEPRQTIELEKPHFQIPTSGIAEAQLLFLTSKLIP